MDEIVTLLEQITDTLQRLVSQTEAAAEGIKTIESALTEYGVDIYGEYDTEV